MYCEANWSGLRGDCIATTKTITIQTRRHGHEHRVIIQKEKLKSTMSPTKSVTFNKNAQMRLTIHINDYTAEEGEACWYRREDYIKMRNDVRCTVNMIEEEEKNFAVVFDDVQCCSRGCENMTQNGAKRKLKRRRKAITAVLSEQYLQQVAHDGSLADHCLLAVACRKYSYRSQQSALSMGLDDEKIIKTTYQEEQVQEKDQLSKRQETRQHTNGTQEY
jgi:hypothetical protein